MPIINFRRSNSESGQVLLVVVLVAVISLTVGLAAVSRSVTNTRVSTEESNSQKALNAAEAGLEEQIKKANDNAVEFDVPIGGTFGNNSEFVARVEQVDGPSIVFNNNEVPVSRTEGADVWLSTYPTFANPLNRTLQIYWENNAGGCANDAAIEVVVLRGNRNTPNLDRYAYDPCAGSRGNNFTPVSAGSYPLSVDGVSYPFQYRVQLPAITSGYLVRIIPIYNDVKIGVRSVAGGDLPPQGFNIESTGKSGETQRKVKVFQSFPTVPIEIFPYNLFNP